MFACYGLLFCKNIKNNFLLCGTRKQLTKPSIITVAAINLGKMLSLDCLFSRRQYKRRRESLPNLQHKMHNWLNKLITGNQTQLEEIISKLNCPFKT